ncbi:MAG: hypothetical protein WC929_07735 [Bacilli bacterium]|jgi:hypothetical protein
MNDIIISIISVAVTTVVLPLITLGGTKLIQYLNQKIKDEKTRSILTGIAQIVERAVRSVFQTYVETLKKSGSFDKEAQANALSLAKAEVLKELNNDTREFITSNYGDLPDFITNQIEATIYLLK